MRKTSKPFRLFSGEQLRRAALVLVAFGVSGWFIALAFKRWGRSAVGSFSDPVFIPVEWLAEYRHAIDWKTPLLAAVAPWVVLGCWLAFRAFLERLRAPERPSAP